ncbi:MAG: biotin--[acetyl-CoA-carboxylase] ligase [Bacillota bacterium]
MKKGGWKLIKTDRLSVDGIRGYLKNREVSGNIIIFDTLASTNHEAKERAIAGAGHGTVILSEGQTKGRGRFGRCFYSPPMRGVYMSIILKSDLPAAHPYLITTAASVAVASAIEAVTGIAAGIKWVNDLHVNGKKVCGILAETVSGCKSGACIVLGIGINFWMRREELPPDLQDTAAALFEEKPQDISRDRLVAAVIDNILEMGPAPRPGDYLPEYKRRSVVLGQEVWITGPGKSMKGRAVDIDENGGLVVIDNAGGRFTLHAEEVSIRGWRDGRENGL